MSRLDFVPFNEAYVNVPVGKFKIQENGYLPKGDYKIVDQGRALIAGYSNETECLKTDVPYILFGDHTKVVKFIDFPFIAGADGVRLYKAADEFDPLYLYYFLRSASLPQDAYGRHSKYLEGLSIPKPTKKRQSELASTIEALLKQVKKAKEALELQSTEVENLSNAIVFNSLKDGINKKYILGEVLDEVKNGIGDTWAEYLLYGATRKGLAFAKEPPGKYPQRYKPVFPGTVFYNPMRILIGSIAFVEDDDEKGITSPDYVVLTGRKGLVDSRWFYYWLRSPLGGQCIASLARGAVRERMLFNRLAEGNIDLPDLAVQERASEALRNLKQVRVRLNKQYKDIVALPNKILSSIFKSLSIN